MRNALSDFQGVFMFMPLAALALGIVVGTVWHRMPVARRWTPTRTALLWTMLCWLTAVLYITVIVSWGSTPTSLIPGSNEFRVDLVPLRDLVVNGPGLGGIGLLERGVNLLMFSVGGVLTALALNWGVLRTALLFLVGGASIELTQFLATDRSVTADDVLWALLGGLLGALIATPLRTTTWYRQTVLGPERSGRGVDPSTLSAGAGATDPAGR